MAQDGYDINPTQMTATSDVAMPQDPEAESSVLSAMMISQDVLQECLIELEPDDFYIPSNRKIYLAMREHLESIAEGVRSVLEVTPPELAGDIAETGILLTGGGALLDGMDKLIEKRTGVHVIVPDDPLECVALGTGYATEHLDILENNGGIFKTREEITGFKD